MYGASTPAIEWLAGVEAPYLLLVHTYDAHWPYSVPEGQAHAFGQQAELEAWLRERRVAPGGVREGVGPEDSRDSLERYDRALRFQDDQLGRLLDALGARPDWGRTAVVIVGDHGEGLSQHAHAAHGGTWHEQLHIPLLLRIPGETPRRVPGLVTVTQSGGWGCWSGLGRMARSDTEKQNPSWLNRSWVHILGSTRTYSSHAFLVMSGSHSNPPNSVHVDERAVPNSRRPPES